MKPVMFDIQIFALVMLLIVIILWICSLTGIAHFSNRTHTVLNVVFYISVIYMIALDINILLPTTIDIRTLTFYYG